MSKGYYTASPKMKWAIGYYETRALARKHLPTLREKYPGVRVMKCEDFWRYQTERALAEFTLTEITAYFYNEMLGVLPPVYLSNCPGFFMSEAVTGSIHTQFLERNGRYYAGNADLSPGGKKWTYADCDRLAPLNWFPKEAAA